MSEARRIVEIADLSVARPGRRALALDRFSLSLNAGERVVVLGEEDCGKEALIGVLGGFVEKPGAISGTIRFGNGEALPIAKRPPATIRIAYLLNPLAQPFARHVSVLAQLSRIVARKLGSPISSAREELRLALERMAGAPSLSALDKKPATLDPVCMAWGLLAAVSAQTPDLVLADHLVADLGPSAQRTLLGALAEEQSRLGYALLYTTGGLQPAARLGGRIIVMRHGRVVEESDFARLASGQAHAYSRRLFKALPLLSLEQPKVRNHMRGQPLLQVHSLDLKADPRARARSRDGITFELRRGASLALIGDEGSGRRALMRAVLGLDRVPAGHVIFDAVDLSILSQAMSWRMRRRIAFITGTDDGLDPRMTLWDAVGEPLRAHLNLKSELVAGYREAALKRVGLASHDGKRPVATLSAFDKRRLQVARAIVSVPLLTVVDEPLRGLDAFDQTIMREVLTEFRASQEPAFLVITSDFTVAQAFADDAMVFEDGRIVEHGPIIDMVRAPRDATTRRLIDAVTLPGLSQKPPSV